MVLARDIRHPGACHLYIHLVEASEEPGLAEACSDYLGDQIAVSHIHHMPTHIYMNIGRWGDAVRGNQRAWHADQKAEHGGPPGVYPSHNLHMLLNAAVMDGQSAVAIQAAKDLARHRGPWAAYIPLTYAAFGRWTEILEGAGPESDEPMELVSWSFARGLAHLRMGHVDVAQKHVDEIDQVLMEADSAAQFRFSPLADVVALPRSILAGEIAHARGMLDQAVAALEAGVETEDGRTDLLRAARMAHAGPTYPGRYPARRRSPGRGRAGLPRRTAGLAESRLGVLRSHEGARGSGQDGPGAGGRARVRQALDTRGHLAAQLPLLMEAPGLRRSPDGRASRALR